MGETVTGRKDKEGDQAREGEEERKQQRKRGTGRKGERQSQAPVEGGGKMLPERREGKIAVEGHKFRDPPKGDSRQGAGPTVGVGGRGWKYQRASHGT